MRGAFRWLGGHSEGQNTRSHPELGRENPQRQWYCALRRGRVGRRQARQTAGPRPKRRNCRPQTLIAGWSSPVARQAHNLKVIGSNPIPATSVTCSPSRSSVTGFAVPAQCQDGGQNADELDLQPSIFGDEAHLIDQLAKRLGRQVLGG